MIAAQDPIRTRADTILAAIKSNAAKLDPAQVPAYYALVTMNIRSLVSVLGYVEQGIASTADASILIRCSCDTIL